MSEPTYEAWNLGDNKWYAKRTEFVRMIVCNSGPHSTEDEALEAVQKEDE